MITSIINADPSSIVVIRHTKVPHAGGFSWTLTTLAAQTVRLYHFTTRNQHEITLPEGEVKTIILGILAQPTADFVVGHDSFDTFTFGGREYRVVGRRVYDDSNVASCIECDCVAV